MGNMGLCLGIRMDGLKVSEVLVAYLNVSVGVQVSMSVAWKGGSQLNLSECASVETLAQICR